jgi:hypothetical protein
MTGSIEEELAAGFREHVADIRLERDVVTAALRRHRRRRTITRSLSVTGGVALVGVVTAAILTAGSSTAPRAPASIDAQLVAHIEDAWSQKGAYVVYQTARIADQRPQQSWYDTRTGQSASVDSPDQPYIRMDVMITPAETVSYYQVIDHVHRTWYVFTEPVCEPFPAGGESIMDVVGRGGKWSPTQLRTALDRHDLVVVAHEQVRGRDTIHLGLRDPDVQDAWEVWVDAKTYVPLRLTNVVGMPGSFRATTDYDWLPRTPEVLAKLTQRPPADYRRTDPPRAGEVVCTTPEEQQESEKQQPTASETPVVTPSP